MEVMSHVQHMTKTLIGWSESTKRYRCGFTQEQFSQLLKFLILLVPDYYTLRTNVGNI